jgi:hypothetical protein
VWLRVSGCLCVWVSECVWEGVARGWRKDRISLTAGQRARVRSIRHRGETTTALSLSSSLSLSYSWSLLLRSSKSLLTCISSFVLDQLLAHTFFYIITSLPLFLSAVLLFSFNLLFLGARVHGCLDALTVQIFHLAKPLESYEIST